MDCSVCSLPLRETESGSLVCGNGHIVQIHQEVADIASATGRDGSKMVKRIKRKPTETVDPVIQNCSSRDLSVITGLNMLLQYFKALKVPVSEYRRYFPLILWFLEVNEREGFLGGELAKYDFGFSAKRLLPLVYLVKRDCEERRGRFFMVHDFWRVSLSGEFQKINFRNTSRELFKATYKPIWGIARMYLTSQEVLRTVRLIFLAKKKKRLCGMYRVLEDTTEIYPDINETLLDVMCAKYGVTKTIRMKKSFKRYREALYYTQLPNNSTPVFPEAYIAIFLYYYMLFSCILVKADEGKGVRIVEKGCAVKTRYVIQDFFNRETCFSTLAQAITYFNLLKKGQVVEKKGVAMLGMHSAPPFDVEPPDHPTRDPYPMHTVAEEVLEEMVETIGESKCIVFKLAYNILKVYSAIQETI